MFSANPSISPTGLKSLNVGKGRKNGVGLRGTGSDWRGNGVGPGEEQDRTRGEQGRTRGEQGRTGGGDGVGLEGKWDQTRGERGRIRGERSRIGEGTRSD